MTVAEKICEKARELPDPIARQVLKFIERVSGHHVVDVEELKNAQEQTMKRIWEKQEDDIWNKL